MGDVSFFYWLGGIAVIIGLLGLVGLFAFWLDRKFERFASRHRDDDEGRTRVAVVLLAGTFALVAGGIALYEAGEVGWAQFAWILASGTAGAGCVAALDREDS